MGVLSSAGREIRTLYALSKAQRAVERVRPEGPETVADAFEARVDEHPDDAVLHWAGNEYTFAELEDAANRIANWALGKGISRGDVVGLMMHNRPEFLFIWLGLAKIGAEVALLSTHLTDGPLLHTLSAAEPKLLLLGSEMDKAYATVRHQLGSAIEAYSIGARAGGCRLLDPEFLDASPRRPPWTARAGMRSGDNLFYVFTSGTTGTPKAALYSHYRFLQTGYAYASIAKVTREDRIHCTLPLYHAVGGIVGVSMAFATGASIVLQERFSANGFWAECRERNVTVLLYLGELCRYLLGLPETAYDRKHTVRCAVGSGLRPDIWERFQARFGVKKILEFYASTEGNVSLVNLDNKVGAIGRVPPYLKGRFSVELVKYDSVACEPSRDEQGRCVRCAPGEAGEAIGRIASAAGAVGRFEGYRNSEETESRILRDVFEEGDSWYRTGDLLRYDEEGYFYFVDRVTDAFRWKGAFVATSEVAEALLTFGGIKEANVYGVEVVGHEGKAGMAAIVVHGGFDPRLLYAHVCRQLRPCARPVFLRIRSEIEKTGTFRYRKVDRVVEGFDPDTVSEPLYFLDDEQQAYVPLDRTLFDRIIAGDIQF
jgi:fatty-acyl-CoA synthase